MSRNLTSAVQAELAAANNRRAVFVELDFASGAVRLWSGDRPITTPALGTMPAATWTGAGTLGAVSTIEESAGLKANGVVLTLSGLAASLNAVALAEHYQGRAARLWEMMFDAAWTPIADPIPLVNGKMDQMELAAEGGTGTIRLSVESRLRDLEHPADPGTYTPEDQKRRFPGDKGLDYVPLMQNKTIFWGREKLKPGKGTGRDGAYGSDPGGLVPGQDTIRSVGGGPRLPTGGGGGGGSFGGGTTGTTSVGV